MLLEAAYERRLGMVTPNKSNICENKFSEKDGMVLGGPPSSCQTNTTRRMPVTGSRGLSKDVVGSMTPAEKDAAGGNLMFGAWRNGAAAGLRGCHSWRPSSMFGRKGPKTTFASGLGEEQQDAQNFLKNNFM